MNDRSAESGEGSALFAERRIVSWWMDKIRSELEAASGIGGRTVTGALHELHTHLKRRYDLEESGGLFDESFTDSPRIARETAKLFKRHHELEGRLEVLLHEIETGSTPLIVRMEMVRRFLDEWTALEQSETDFFQRVAYEEYGGGS
jgi:hypothetical protein